MNDYPAISKVMINVLLVAALLFLLPCCVSNTGGGKTGEKTVGKIDQPAAGGTIKREIEDFPAPDVDDGEPICVRPPLIASPSVPPASKPTSKDPKKIYLPRDVQVQAKFSGGMDKFKRYITNNLDNIDIGNVDAGTLRMQFRFIIEKDGRLSDVQILDDGGYPKAAARVVEVLNKSPKWSPATINGKPVRMAYVLPIYASIIKDEPKK